MVDVLLNTLQVVGTLVIGMVTVPLFDKLKEYWTWLDSRPVWLKQVLVVVTTAVLTFLVQGAAAFGVSLNIPVDVLVWEETTVSAFLSAVLAFAIKAGKQAKKSE